MGPFFWHCPTSLELRTHSHFLTRLFVFLVKEPGGARSNHVTHLPVERALELDVGGHGSGGAQLELLVRHLALDPELELRVVHVNSLKLRDHRACARALTSNFASDVNYVSDVKATHEKYANCSCKCHQRHQRSPAVREHLRPQHEQHERRRT